MKLLFFSSRFCDPCIVTRRVLDEVSSVVPDVSITEIDVASRPDAAEQASIRSTPTVVVLTSEGAEVFRAEGAPTVNQVLVALARAM